MARCDVAFIVFAHRRYLRLSDVLHHLTLHTPKRTGLSTRVCIVPDRPSPEVRGLVHCWEECPQVIVRPFGLPIVSPQHGQLWTAARNHALAAIDETGWNPRWVANFDDDFSFGPGWQKLGECLRRDDVWSWRAVSMFLWDEDQNVNVRQRHNSPLFGRHERGWRRNPEMTNQIAQEVEDHVAAHPETELYLPFYIVDRGTMSPKERERLYRTYANAGKLDDYTRRYVEEPRLFPLHDLLRAYPSPHEYWKYQLGIK